jgi:putative ABC transport system ATP-binding protein
VALFELEDVTVTRPRGSDHAHPLLDVRVDIDERRCTAVVGPSGAGKSTLLRLLDRLEEPSHGEVRFHGEPLRSYAVTDLRRRVGFVQQLPVLLGTTVRDDVRTARPDADVDALLERVGLPAEFGDRLTAELSGGEGQRVCLARALSVEPEVLLLDEPTSALDRKAAQQVEAVIRGLVAGGMTAVVVTHDLAQAERLADDVVVVVAGSVVESGPSYGVLGAPQDERTKAFLGRA